MRLRNSKLAIVVAMLVSGPLAGQAVIQVPTDFATIQAAIDFASDGDTVELLPGTYVENVDLLGKAIVLTSTDGASVTTIDGSACTTGSELCSTISCRNGEGRDTVLTGLTITGGSGTTVVSSGLTTIRGGGMYSELASPTVTDCVFVGNGVFTGYGGGICNYNNVAEITDCEFTGNTGRRGAGITNLGSNATISNCTFLSNSGSGIANRPTLSGGPSDATITACTFIGNIAHNGGGVFNSDSHPTITSCTFEGNTAFELGGGGIMNFSDSSSLVVGCTFVGNLAMGAMFVDDGFGGAIGNLQAEGSTILGCSFFGNISDGGVGGGVSGGAFGGTSTDTCFLESCVFSGNSATYPGGAISVQSTDVVVRNCTFNQDSAVSGSSVALLGNTAGLLENCLFHPGDPISIIHTASSLIVSHCCNAGVDGVGGNFYAEPQFVDPPGADGVVGTADDDLHLRVTSPCIDTGDATLGLLWDFDLDGQARTICGGVDIGADEFDGCPESFVRGDGNDDGAVDIGDPVHALSYLFMGEDASCLDAHDSNDDGAVDIGDPVYTLGHLFSGGPAPLLPYPDCGSDRTGDGIACESYLACP
ncbi:MAG: right-handed parallel beta-helix repeat-containing protein [Planctomycetes bacterium]|nr:right-handed parallel beta-helix repeat-containing protein [Planctomycetota bacterium]